MILSFFTLVTLSVLHPLHISVTEIKFDATDKELEISSRIFIDDLEEAIQQELKRPSLDILSPGKEITTDLLLGNYLATRLTIKADGKMMKIKYLGHEIEGDAMIVYLYVPNIKKLKEIDVFNSTITEVYDDQSNLVHVTVGDRTRSLRLVRGALLNKLVFEK
jgi:hypothetical protein